MCARPLPPPLHVSPTDTAHGQPETSKVGSKDEGAKTKQTPNMGHERPPRPMSNVCTSQHTSHMPLKILSPVQRPHHLLAAWQPRHKPKRAQQREIVMQHKCLCCQETWLGQARALHVMHHNKGFPELLQCQTATWLRVRQDSVNLLL
jgi:hypothetical protein